MPYYVTSRVIEALNANGKSLLGSKVLLLGITYKRDVADIRESPALKLLHLLQQRYQSNSLIRFLFSLS